MMLTGVVLTKNEERNMVPCLKSLAFCDELVVIDDESSDATREKARLGGAQVFIRNLGNDFSSSRNFGLQRAHGDWVLFIDADERVTPSLAQEIKTAIRSKGTRGYEIRRQDVFLGRPLHHGEVGNKYFLRLARRGAGFWRRPVHEFWAIKGKRGSLKHPLLHEPHPTISEFLAEINYYTTIEARHRRERGEKSSLVYLFAYPLAKFFTNFVFRLGFLDGFPGFVLAYMMAMHSLVARVKHRTANL